MYGGPEPMGLMGGAPGPSPPALPPHMMPRPVAPGGPAPCLMDPSTNNQPLQFNTSQGKPPMVKDMRTDSPDQDERNLTDNFGHSPDLAAPPHMSGPMQQGQGMGPMQGPWGPMIGPNMMGMDPNLMMNQMAYAQPYGYMGPVGPMDGAPVVKEIITLESCTLQPPPPNAPPPTTRPRPPGCKTAFVGGLPENMTEEALTEIFDNFGVICSKRMSKKHFAHIRFELEESVERSLYISGYRLKLENKDDKDNTGRLHVDYAQARDDLYEWECQQRTLAREERHRVRMEQAHLHPPSPPPVVRYSEHEATVLIEELKNEENFTEASETLIRWLDRGDCNRRSSNNFYIMIQGVNSQIRRLLTEKQSHDEELENVRIQFRLRLEGILRQFEQIENVFTATSKQKAWDHFSKAQRKNIDSWRKQAKEVSKTQRDEFLKGREEAEMEMSDSEEQEAPPKKKKYMDSSEYAHAAMLEWQSTQLRDENDSLKCQLEAYKNEVDLVKQETTNTDDSKDRQMKALQQALQGMQQQLIQANKKNEKSEEEIKKLKQRPAPTAHEPATETVTVLVVDGDSENDLQNDKQDISIATMVENNDEDTAESSSLGPHSILPDSEARILALLSTFLHVHPFGASVDYIWSYLHKLEIKVRTGELEDLMERYPSLFKLHIHGVGASIEKRWRFTGFDLEQKNILIDTF